MRLVQLVSPASGRRVARVEEPRLALLAGSSSLYALAHAAIVRGISVSSAVDEHAIESHLSYDTVYQGRSEWRFLPAFDHPAEPARCLVAGTGLTHLASARNRDAMHAAPKAATVVTDSMRMFQAGVEGGKPSPGQIGVAPEWFYKGDGSCLRAHREPIASPAYADDGGEEPEVAGCYLIGQDGLPRRVGFACGNEFSDHAHERKNYLYLAESKLRQASIGPELLVGELPAAIDGRVSVERRGVEIWSTPIASGESNTSHSLANLEHHHFKHPAHRRPGDAHVHFFGADAFSFGAGVRLEDGDVMAVSWDGLGRALRNPLRIERAAPSRIGVVPL